jgi:hypothetical protein
MWHEHYGAQAFYSTYWVSDTFVVSSGTPTTNGISIWTWGWPTDHALTAEVTITSQPNGGTVYFDQVIQFSESNCYADGFGFNHCQRTANWNSGPVLNDGTYWVTLKNGSFPSGTPTLVLAANRQAVHRRVCGIEELFPRKPSP